MQRTEFGDRLCVPELVLLGALAVGCSEVLHEAPQLLLGHLRKQTVGIARGFLGILCAQQRKSTQHVNRDDRSISKRFLSDVPPAAAMVYCCFDAGARDVMMAPISKAPARPRPARKLAGIPLSIPSLVLHM